MKGYPEELIDEIRNRLDIVDVISEHVALKKKGKNFVGLCPFHAEKTPSFTVSPEKQVFHCFGCGVGGDVFSFLMKKENISFPEALSIAADRTGISLENRKDDYSGYMGHLNSRKRQYDANREAALYFHSCLVKNEKGTPGLNYLLSRGLTIRTIKSFGLGFATPDWDGLKNHLLNKGFSEEFLIETGLLVKTKKGSCDRFYNRIMFPILDVHGRITGFGGRVLDNSRPKYLNSPETGVFSKRRHLYGLNFAKDHAAVQGIVIVEGYMDVIALHQHGIKNAVASLGTSLTPEQAKLIKRFTDNVTIAYDADTAGQAATLRGLDILKAAGLTVKVLELSAGSDPDEFIRREGRDAFLDLLNQALPLVDYKIKTAEKGLDLTTLQGRVGFMNRVLPVLNQISNEIEKDAYIKKLSARLKITEESIRIELAKLGGNRTARHILTKKRNNIKNKRENDVQPAFLNAERVLLSLALSSKNLFEKITRELNAADFFDETHRRVFTMITETYNKNDRINPVELIDHSGDEDAVSLITEMLNREHNIESPDKVIDDCLKQIRVFRIRKRMEDIKAQLKTLENSGDLTQSRELIMEYQQLLNASQNI